MHIHFEWAQYNFRCCLFAFFLVHSSVFSVFFLPSFSFFSFQMHFVCTLFTGCDWELRIRQTGDHSIMVTICRLCSVFVVFAYMVGCTNTNSRACDHTSHICKWIHNFRREHYAAFQYLIFYSLTLPIREKCISISSF